jgi:hypothetical protein
LEDNGSFLSNNHTPLIAHTADDLLTQFSGLYGDRHGMGVSNSYEYYDGTNVKSADSFVYWTSPIIDHATQTPSTTDLNPSMVYSADVPPAPVPSPTGHDAMAPAPWATYTKAGCTVGDFSTANMVLEKFADIPTVFGADSPEAQQLAADTADPFKDAEIDDYIGMSIHCGQKNGVNDPLCTSASAVKFNQTTATPTAVAETLPDEPGGYDNFVAVHGSRYITPVIGGGPNVVHNGSQVTDADGNLVDLDGHTIVGAFKDKRPPFTAPIATFNPGFPGFSPTASQSLAYVADMQEAGIPVTYAYVSDAHDAHGTSGNIHFAYAPGEAGYVQQLHDYDQAFESFFNRLAADGINKSNTLFLFTVDEGDHFAGSQPNNPSCDGVTVPCDYGTNPVGEINGNLSAMIRTQYGDTTPFSVHSDDAPNVYITGNPSQTSTVTRNLEREMSTLHWTNPYTGLDQHGIMVALADKTEMRTLHMVTSDPFRTPTFTPFADPDWFFFASNSPVTCATDAACAFIPARTSQSFAWNHGDVQDEIASTWAGYVGPGVRNLGDTNSVWTDHTDHRPTLLTLLGLKDDYQTDGRTLTEIANQSALPVSLRVHHPSLERLAASYKQLMASFGTFSMDTLKASTRALASNSPGDQTYTDTESAIESLTNQRNALAAQIRTGLNQAEFDGVAPSENDLKAWTKAADDLLAQAAALASSS